MNVQLILCSHSPLMRKNMRETHAGAQAAFMETMQRVSQELARFEPEVVVCFGPDHFNGFFYDLMPSFCIGVKAEGTHDWGIPGGPLRVPSDLALACVRHLHRHEFDTAISHEMKVDHGSTVSLLQIAGALDRYPVLPIFVNCAADPRPTLRRSRAFGTEVGRFLLDRGLRRVAVVGSGGLSHDPPTPRLGTASEELAKRLIRRAVPSAQELGMREARVMKAATELVDGTGPCLPPDPAWDAWFLGRITAWDVQALDAITDEELDTRAGYGGHEVRTWFAGSAAARALAAPHELKAQQRFYKVIPEWLTGMGVVTGHA
ncbi:DODA-type extradiol aromatic ring-opening family dioxygenase [Ramlibacter sp. AN1133]|uniref:DODA-type extradiol aromatic ring-opening family dioxygenase n=1 Tax=Ramlibacter sp. AN1133 TaxID=3133429 RepID=UPI0030BBE596